MNFLLYTHLSIVWSTLVQCSVFTKTNWGGFQQMYDYTFYSWDTRLWPFLDHSCKSNSCSTVGFAESSDWFVRPHQLQSRGEIPLIDGSATAICAAYQQIELMQFEYYVCALPDVANASLSACLFNSLNCCSCRDDSCQLGINVTQDTLVDSLGIPTYGCRVDSTVEGNFACVVEKNISEDSAKQFIGNFSFGPAISASFMIPPCIIWSTSGGGIILVVILILVLICIAVRCYRRCVDRRRKQERALPLCDKEEGEDRQ